MSNLAEKETRRSEEHTSELQSRLHLVCRLLLEKKIDRVPPTYIRKQTVANGERFITQNLKEMEVKILGSEQRSVKLEYDLFQRVRFFFNDTAATEIYTLSLLAPLPI